MSTYNQWKQETAKKFADYRATIRLSDLERMDELSKKEAHLAGETRAIVERKERLVKVLEEADRIDRLLAQCVKGTVLIAALLGGLYAYTNYFQ